MIGATPESVLTTPEKLRLKAEALEASHAELLKQLILSRNRLTDRGVPTYLVEMEDMAAAIANAEKVQP